MQGKRLQRWAWSTLLGLALGLGFGAEARAVPLGISLAELKSRARTVVVARLVGPEGLPPGLPADRAERYRLEVERVLRGAVRPGPLIVRRSPEGAAHLPPGTRCVAFVDGEGYFRWAGRLKVGASLEAGLLELAGFYDFNAYLVSPALLTLAQLERYLATGELRYTFSGKLHFVSRGAGRPVPSAIALSVAVDGRSGAAVVKGLPPLKGFRPRPAALVSPGHGPDLTLTYERNLYRPLVVAGNVLSVGPGGLLETMFWVAEPELLSEALFLRYVRDSRRGPPVHRLAVVLAGGETWTFTLGEKIGRLGEIRSPAGRAYPFSALSMAPARFLEARADGGILRVALDPRRPGLKLIEGTGADGELLQELLSAPLPCTFSLRGGSAPRAATRCTLELRATDLARR